MNEREKRERASREREQEREEARAKPAREEKKSVLFSRERERAEPAAFRRPALVHCQLESEGETPCPRGARELCLGRERERERESKTFFEIALLEREREQFGRDISTSQAHFFLSLFKKIQ